MKMPLFPIFVLQIALQLSHRSRTGCDHFLARLGIATLPLALKELVSTGCAAKKLLRAQTRPGNSRRRLRSGSCSIRGQEILACPRLRGVSRTFARQLRRHLRDHAGIDHSCCSVLRIPQHGMHLLIFPGLVSTYREEGRPP